MSIFKNINWTKEQESVLSAEGNLIVNGTAGAGKTVLALKKAIDLKEKGKSVCLVVFTKALKTFLIDNLGKEDFDKSILINYEYEWDNSENDYDYILIDEFQDFSLTTLQEFKKFAKLGILYFGDLEQKLYETNFNKEKTVSIEQIKELNVENIINLKENFRIPQQIVHLANNICFIEKNKKSLKLNKNLNSLIPKIFAFDNHKDELDFLVTTIKENFENMSIGILLNNNKSSEYTSVRSFFDTNFENIPSILEIRNYLTEKLNINIGYKYERENHLDFKNRQSVNILTIHSSKGLEFDIVILPFSKMSNAFIHKNQIYVALTRSKNKVIITYSGQVQNEYIGINKNLVNGNLITILNERL